MAQIDDIINEIKNAVGPLAAGMVSKYADQAKADVNQFLQDSKASLDLWRGQLANKDITIKEFEYLVGGLADIAELKILKNTELAQQRVLQFIGGVINIIIDIILKRVTL